MAIIYRPDGETDLTNAVLVAEGALPQDITGLAAGSYEVGRIAWAPDAVVVTGVPSEVAPSAFTSGQWSLADSPSAGGDRLTLTISGLPYDGGSAITALQYRVGGGAAVTLSGTGTGARQITVLAETLASVQVRAVNAIGPGDWSTAKTATPTVEAGGVGPYAVTSAPDARWHADHSTVTKVGDDVHVANSLVGSTTLNKISDRYGMNERTNAAGEKFWRFRDGNHATGGNVEATGMEGGPSVNGAAHTIIMVARMHSTTKAKSHLLGVGTEAGADRYDRVLALGNDLGRGNRLRGTNFAPSQYGFFNGENMMAGTQLAVYAKSSSPAGATNPGQRIWVNGERQTISTSPAGATDYSGINVGYADVVTNSGEFDLYELFVFARDMTDAEVAAAIAEIRAAWDIPDITSQLILEGDSITAGTNEMGDTIAGILTEPGRNLIPKNFIVMAYATGSATISKLVERRDLSSSWITRTRPDQNLFYFSAGGEDTQTDAENRADEAAYVQSVLAAGFSVTRREAMEGKDVTVETNHNAYYNSAAYLNDCLANTGQTYDGMLSILTHTEIEVDGYYPFKYGNAGDLTYFQGDYTHLTDQGVIALTTGMDTPQHGVGSIA